MTTTNLEQGGYGTVAPVGLQLGSVEGKQKGSERMSLGVSHLIGPRVVAAGIQTLTTSSTTTVVPVPTIFDAAVTANTSTVTNYAVVLTPANALAATNVASMYVTLAAERAAGSANISNGRVDEFTITGTSSGSAQIVNWALLHL